jgi:hypothetical protein
MHQLLENQMFLRSIKFQNLYSPEESVIGDTGSREELSADDILSKLNASDPGDEDDSSKDNNEESDESSDEKEKEETKGDEEEVKVVDELAELEEELKEPSDEDLELKTPVQRRALMKDYPDIFKKHPGLESTIYREHAYTELLPTINDAKEALAAKETLVNFEKDLTTGNTVKLMSAVKADDPKAFAKLADNYMENLAQVDERAFHHVLGNITKDIVKSMLEFGKSNEDEEVQSAASILYKFMFNSTKWQGKQKLSTDEVINESVSAEKQKLDKERKEFEDSKKNEHTSKLMTSVNKQVKGTIEKSIDPKDQMTPFVKSKAIEEVLNKAENLLKSDKRFQTIVQQLTDRAGKEKFSDEAMKRIRSAYFTKYNSILIPIIKAVRAEALKGNTKSRIKEEVETNDTTERANRAKPQGQNNGGNKNADNSKPKPGESSLDFLMRRAK